MPGPEQTLKQSINQPIDGDAALDTAGTVKEGVLQKLEVPKRDNGCISGTEGVSSGSESSVGSVGTLFLPKIFCHHLESIARPEVDSVTL